MKVGEFCDSLLRRLSSYAYTKSEVRYQRRDILPYLNDGIGTAVEADFFKEYNLGNFGNVDAGFIQTFDNNGAGIPVLYSTTRNAYYVDLPNLPIALPSGLGLFEIFPSQDPSSAYVPLQPGSAGLYKGLESENLFGEAGYRQEGRKAWFVNGDFKSQHNPTVIINMLCDTSTLSMDDELPIPPNYIGLIREATFKSMVEGLQIPVDTTLNSTPDNRKT